MLEGDRVMYTVTMQSEILVQCLANMGLLALPLMLQTGGYITGPLKVIEIAGMAGRQLTDTIITIYA